MSTRKSKWKLLTFSEFSHTFRHGRSGLELNNWPKFFIKTNTIQKHLQPHHETARKLLHQYNSFGTLCKSNFVSKLISWIVIGWYLEACLLIGGLRFVPIQNGSTWSSWSLSQAKFSYITSQSIVVCCSKKIIFAFDWFLSGPFSNHAREHGTY